MARSFSNSTLPFVMFLFCMTSPLCCAVNAQDCPAKNGDCLVDHGGPGCTDAVCCEIICGIDPICCAEWDSTCASQADTLCSSLCGASAAGSCFIANATPSCSIGKCCELVCLADPFCCSDIWDTTCALLASFSCEDTNKGKCGDPNAGECSDANGIPACSDTQCCERVCEIDPGCCNSAWDIICVGLAATLCSKTCAISPPPGTPQEGETCGDDSNDPCSGGTMEQLVCGSEKAGRFRDGTDIDIYSIDLEDQDGDGFVRLRVTFATSVPAVLDVLTDTCDQPVSLMTIEGDSCIGYAAIACLPSGSTRIRLAPLAEPTICNDEYHYLVTVECIDFCGEACENDEPCLLPHESPGCDTPSCCEMVCDAIPACCEWSWDSTCASAAAELCGGPAPENDLCDNALEAFVGLTPFRQALSTTDKMPATSCIGKTTLTSGDVWFRHTVTCEDDLLIGTCSVIDFDSIVEIYRGSCEALEFVACSVETPACNFGSSLVQLVSPICGETIFVRVSGNGDSSGTGDLSITCLGNECDCVGDTNGDQLVNGADLGLLLIGWGQENATADFNGDGTVDGADLGMLLAAWGNCG